MSRPSVTLKLAMSLDGAIALMSGESQWITGPEARAEAHKLRAAHDAVLVGIGTALADDPELTARTDPAPQRQPLRVVLDRRFRLSPDSKLARSVGLGPVMALSTDVGGEVPAGLAASGVIVERATPELGQGEIAAVLRALSRRGVTSVLVEGGGGVAASFLREGLVDRLELFRAPMIIGGDGLRGVGPLGVSVLGAAPRFTLLASRRVGADLWQTYTRI